jgi:hypothetical protein
MKLMIALYGRSSAEDIDEIGYNSHHERALPWLKGEVVLCLGEIENIKGQAAFARKNGSNVFFGYDLDDFIDLNPELNEKTFKKTDCQSYDKYHCLENKTLFNLINILGR